ncbi:MAG: hypothetical protein R2758_14040 [Bacteroidales bacterium]
MSQNITEFARISEEEGLRLSPRSIRCLAWPLICYNHETNEAIYHNGRTVGTSS